MGCSVRSLSVRSGLDLYIRRYRNCSIANRPKATNPTAIALSSHFIMIAISVGLSVLLTLLLNIGR